MAEGIVEELRASYSKLRPIRKVIRTKYGVAAGETRKLAVQEWPEVMVDVPNFYEHLKIVAADNIHAEKPAEWWERVTNQAAAELVKMGTQPHDVATHLVSDFPMSERKVLRYLHEEFKRPEKVKAGKASAEVKAALTLAPIPRLEADSAGLRRVGYTPRGASLVAGTVNYPIRGSDYARRTYTPEEEALQDAFAGSGFDLSFQHPVPMDKWKCEKCRSTWIEDPPQKCPKDGVVVGRLLYHVDILLRYKQLKWAIEPGGKQHDFDSDKKRDDFLRAHSIEPFHFDNELVRAGAWFIVEYFKLLRQLRDPEEHVLAIEGHCRHIIHNTTEIVGPSATFTTQRPAVVKIIIRN